MDNETVDLVKRLFEDYSNKDSGTVTAAYITIGGMLGVAILGVISQWVITRRIVSEEHKRILMQVNSERFARQHEKWEADIIEGISGLLKATDPEINPKINHIAVTGYVLRVQLLLNTNDPNQDRVNKLVNQLALTANGWQPAESPSVLLRIHDQLLEATKPLIYRPTNNT
ncbi:MAG: hypothetical protein JAY67_19040 [Candidatus Thiodiazotropha taylori]|nr:hypothetical protein [Candidatus Thiodiazotropha taylori]